VQQVVKVSTGQYPQPFWISAVKRAAAKIKAGSAKHQILIYIPEAVI
jgi:hypothetical protein